MITTIPSLLRSTMLYSGQYWEQNTGPGGSNVHDPQDEPGAEMSKEARVWRIYVREADKCDLEMFDGPKNSLDVLLLFAALFSAILTAFLIESIRDLKPDPIDSSTQVLVTMSLTLTAIANGQAIASPLPVSAPEFTPSHTAIVVNTLWLLSLTLSVAVSLVAMLAKGWCYKFISGRSGPAYEQARRRQHKWNGIQRWKMNKILEYLPGAMHLALVLFAAGLCVYLRDINASVAWPVIIVTGLATTAYVCASILPTLDPDCPYDTPAMAILHDLKMALAPIIKFLSTLLGKLLILMNSTSSRLDWKLHSRISAGVLLNVCKYASEIIYVLLGPSKKMTSACIAYVHQWIRIGVNLFVSHRIGDTYSCSSKVPMDSVTSQMIAWLIDNCEDSRSVDAALQALSGAEETLPRAPLEHCEVAQSILARLYACIQYNVVLKHNSVKSVSQLSVALRYCRAFTMFMSGNPRVDAWGKWGGWYGAVSLDLHKGDIQRICSIHRDLTGLVEADNLSLRSVAIAASMRWCHWYDAPERGQLENTLEDAKLILRRYIEGETNLTSVSVMSGLVKSISHGLIGLRYNHDSLSQFHILFVNIFLVSYGTASEISSAASVALAATVLSVQRYPGGESPTETPDTRRRRAVQVLKHYQSQPPNQETSLALFIFGFFGLFGMADQDRLNFSYPNIKNVARLDEKHSTLGWCSDQFMRALPRLNLVDSPPEIHTLPSKFPFDSYALIPARKYFLSMVKGDLGDHELAAVTACLPLMVHSPSPAVSDPEIYVTALIELCQTKKKILQDLYTRIVNAQPLPDLDRLLAWVALPNPSHSLEQLWRTVLRTSTEFTPLAALHLELLVARILTMNGVTEVHRSALRPLLKFRNEFPKLRPSNPLNRSILVSNLGSGEHPKVLLRIMQCAVDFCEKGWAEEEVTWAESLWYAKLEELKVSYCDRIGVVLSPHEEGDISVRRRRGWSP